MTLTCRCALCPRCLSRIRHTNKMAAWRLKRKRQAAKPAIYTWKSTPLEVICATVGLWPSPQSSMKWTALPSPNH